MERKCLNISAAIAHPFLADLDGAITLQLSRLEPQGKEPTAPDAKTAARPINGQAAQEEQADQPAQEPERAHRREAVQEDHVLRENNRQRAENQTGEQVEH